MKSLNEVKTTTIKVGDKVKTEVTKGQDAKVTKVITDVPRIGTMVHIEWEDKKKGLMKWSGKPEDFSLVEGFFSKSKTNKVEQPQYSEMNKELSDESRKIGKESFKVTNKLLPLLKKELALMKQSSDIYRDSIEYDGPNKDHSFYKERTDLEIEKYEDIIFGIERGIW